MSGYLAGHIISGDLCLEKGETGFHLGSIGEVYGSKNKGLPSP